MEPPPPTPAPRPWEWLYSVVGAGMWGFTRARFHVEVIGPVPRVAPGQLWVVTHRAETDAPLLAGTLMYRGGMWRRGAPRMHFAARDDLFLPGVVTAGVRLPAPLARAARPLTPGPWLGRVRTHPVRRPTGLKLAQAIDGLDGGIRLDDLLASEVRRELDATAADRGLPAPQTVADLRHPALGAALWDDLPPGGLDGPVGDVVRRRHSTRAAGDVRRLVGIVATGAPLLLFPEGRVSPDGALGPVSEMVRVIARRGGVESIIPVAVAYDPLRPRRPAVALHAGPPVPPSADDPAGAVLAAFRAAMPRTTGQVLARLAGTAPVPRGLLLRELAAAADAARAEGRPLVAALRTGRRRGRALDGALRVLARRGLVEDPAADPVVWAPGARDDRLLARLAVEDDDVGPGTADA